MIKGRLVLIGKIVGVILLFCIVGVGILSLDRILTPNKTAAETFEEAKQKLIAKQFDDGIYSRRNVVNYLIAGVDKTESQEQYDGIYNNLQADFILLLTIDKSARSIEAININRDTWTEYDILGLGGRRAGKDEGQIALSHTYGDGKQQSAENLRRAVSNLLFDVKIDHYITLRMDAIPAFADYIGGVTLTLGEDEDLSAKNPTWLPGATVTITGEDAEYWVRSRQGVQDETNVSRMSRQNKYMEALAKAIGEKAWDVKYLLGAYNSIADYTVTDYSNVDDLMADLTELFDAFGLYYYKDITELKGEVSYYTVTEGGQEQEYVRFDADAQALEKLVKEKFYRKIDNDNKK